MVGSLSSLIPSPLHPAVVHLPIALTILVPVFAVGALIAIRSGTQPVRTWAIVAAMSALLSISAWASMETGEDQEDVVEKAVSEAAVETHEEAAETFLWLSLGVLGIAGVGLVRGTVGARARVLATLGSAGLLVAGYRVGHSGGELVYTYGAASAYTDSTRIHAVSVEAREQESHR